MPRRWLSMRTNKDEPTTDLKASQGFDFAFGIKSTSADSILSSQHSKRPFISDKNPARARRKPDLTLLIERPPSSRGSSRRNASHSASRSESSCIGVAFGSPLHPPQNPQYPQNFGPTASNMSLSTHCFLDGSSPNRTPSIKKWKRIGSLFRPRSNSEKVSPLGCHCEQQFNTATHKLDASIHRAQWCNPRSSPNTHDSFDTVHAVPRNNIRNERPRTSHGYDASSFPKSMETHPVPSLQVKIPGSPFDRYSVMFKNINATPQLTLHSRRSRTMESIMPEPSPLCDTIISNETDLKRRATSPTVSKADAIPESGPKPSSATRYSLFPTTPTLSRPQSQHRPSTPSHSRPWTAPGQVPPLQSESSSPHKQRLQISTSRSRLRVVDLEKELPLPGPPALPVTRNISNHSRGSSNGEIFFDVKSFRDSKGMEVTQYEMTRPPSAELQLARSKSNARKKMQRQPSTSSMPEEVEEKPGKSTSAQIDDTIALVESLTSASALAVADKKSIEKELPEEPVSHHQQAIAAPSSETDCVTINSKTKKALKLKSEGLNIDVPSPVLESIEETSPRTVSSRHSIALVTESPAVARINHIASRSRANSNDTRVSRARLDQALPFPYPPTVPVKSSKLIPLSKYAPRHTTEDLARQTGLRPIRPLRSNTDGTASYNHGSSVFRKQVPIERSCTMPTVLVSSSARESMSPPMLAGHRSSPRINQEMPMVVAYVKPSAEVSVARTVSLSRKASAKITVSKQPSKNTPRISNHSEEDVTQKNVVERLPVLQEVNSKHKPGLSQNVVLELEPSIPSSPGTLHSVNDFTKTLDVFPTPPMATV